MPTVGSLKNINTYIPGATNPYQLMIFVAMAWVWTLTAMPLLVSAFFLGDICVDEKNCTLTPGSLIKEVGIILDIHVFSSI